MKRLFLFTTMILLQLACWAQSDKEIVRLELYASSFTAFYYVAPSRACVWEYGMYLEIPDYSLVENSCINEYLTQLNPDMETKVNEVTGFRAILTACYSDHTQETFFITRNEIIFGDVVYKPHYKLFKAIYSLLPSRFWLDDRYDRSDKDED